MPILTKEVEVKPSGKSIQYYKNLGYDVKWHEPIMVKVEDLPKDSKKEIDVKCFVCKDTKTTTYQKYNKSLELYGYYTCKKCSFVKQKETLKVKYGVDNIFQTQECKDKIRATFREKYNCDNPMQNNDIKRKQQDSLMKNFGVKVPLQNEEIKQRAKETTFERYGYYYASQSKEFRENVVNTMMSKYNVKYPMQSSEIKAKANETLYRNGTQKTSKQQLYLHSILGGKLNYPISYYAIDICFPEEKLALEYDGGFHDGRVKLGRLTQEEFDRKELVRDKVIKSEGYKIIRILSQKDRLPQDSTLLQMLQDAKQYFSDYPNHSWFEFNIDTSTVRNAEHKEGISYDFGELRTIKDKDIDGIEDNAEIA